MGKRRSALDKEQADGDPGSSVKEKRRKLDEEQVDGDPRKNVNEEVSQRFPRFRKVSQMLAGSENPQEEDPEPKRSRTSKGRKMKEDEDDAVEEVPRRTEGEEVVIKKKKGMVCDRPSVKPRGVACPLCGKKDGEEDEIESNRSMMWGYPPVQDQLGVWRNQGSLCYYCHRTYLGMYNNKYRVKTLIVMLGKKKEEMNLFLARRGIMVTQLKEKRSYRCPRHLGQQWEKRLLGAM